MSEPVQQAKFWDERADAWSDHADGMEEFASQFGRPAMDRLDPRPGQHLGDVGCGPGITTIELGERVASSGSATGVDVSARMVETARRRAIAADAQNVRFIVSDPGIERIGSFDGLYSRFGVMFFEDSATAFTNLCQSVRPGGRFVAVVWAEMDANPWMFVPTLFGAGPLGAELSLPGPDEPGPFSLADPERTTTLLETCGFGDVDVVRSAQSAPGLWVWTRPQRPLARCFRSVHSVRRGPWPTRTLATRPSKRSWRGAATIATAMVGDSQRPPSSCRQQFEEDRRRI